MEKKSFDMMKKGYNRYQVDDYIQTCEFELVTVKEQLEQANKLKESYEREAQEYKKLYEELRDSLQVKENAAFDMTRIAMREANLIVDTAHLNADVIVKESLMMAREVLSQIARIGKEADLLKGSMQERLRHVQEALDAFETPNIPNMDLLDKK